MFTSEQFLNTAKNDPPHGRVKVIFEFVWISLGKKNSEKMPLKMLE